MPERERLVTAPNLVIALDLDGTLIPFAPTPYDARIDEDTMGLLDALSATPGVTLGLVSGRPRELLEDLPPRFPMVGFAAEHGAWRCSNGVWEAAIPPVPRLQEIVQSLQALSAQFPGSLIEKKSCSVCLHWRLVARDRRDQLIAAAEMLADEWLETNPSLERLPANEALEIRHRSAHKGVAIGWLRERGAHGSMVLAIGDDVTDEDMFLSLREGDMGICVARDARRTEASFRLVDPPAVHRFLHWLIEARAARVTTTHPELTVMRAQSPPLVEPRLIVASNRLPSTSALGRGREVGGLVSALVPVLQETQGVWLGWSGAERDPGLRVRVEHGGPITRAQFDYPPTWRELFYAGFCNQCLWPLLHGFRGRVRFIDDEWACYLAANQAYADAMMSIGGPEAEVWIQDFHLMLAGHALRAAGHRGKIGFYLHVPFPPLDVLETMPWCKEILAGLLACDLVGFQCARWRGNAIHAVKELLGPDLGQRAERIFRTIAVGIDPDQFAVASTSAPSGELGAFELDLGGRKLILGVDRLDYSKGIPERLAAFARMLEKYPRWRGNVSFVQVSVPTRSEVTDYAELRGRVESLVGRINGQYGEADWTPVRYLYRSYDQATLARLYRLAAVGYVTPLCDGMNLVAKEYIASQDERDPGVLVLSRFCGAAERMTSALITNPYHVDGVAADLDAALRMPREERIGRFAELRRVVWEDTASAWSKQFLRELRATTS